MTTKLTACLHQEDSMIERAIPETEIEILSLEVAMCTEVLDAAGVFLTIAKDNKP